MEKLEEDQDDRIPQYKSLSNRKNSYKTQPKWNNRDSRVESELKSWLDKLVGVHQLEVNKDRELNRKTLVQYQSHAIISMMESLKHHT